MSKLVVLHLLLAVSVLSSPSRATASLDFNSSAKEHWDCHRPWPSLSLFLPFKSFTSETEADYYELREIFLRTFLFFWPLKDSNVSLTLVYDTEREQDAYIKLMKQHVHDVVVPRVPGGVNMINLPPSIYYPKGYDRQQYYMFVADKYTTSEYVGFADTDAAFVTYIDREDLFENGKPVINGRIGVHTVPYDLWPYGSWRALGILEPMACMTYFPVIVKTAHLKLMREYMAARFKKSFEEVFRTEFVTYSQFGIMCTYLWAKHRDEYTWYVHDVSPDWDGKKPKPKRGQDGNVKQFTDAMRLPKPRVATHTSWRNFKYSIKPVAQSVLDHQHPQEMTEFLQQGYCRSPPFPHAEAICASVDPLQYYPEMYSFDGTPYDLFSTPEKLSLQAHKRHHRMKHCHPEWDERELKAIGLKA